jgi:hypothetical protein
MPHSPSGLSVRLKKLWKWYDYPEALKVVRPPITSPNMHELFSLQFQFPTNWCKLWLHMRRHRSHYWSTWWSKFKFGPIREIAYGTLHTTSRSASLKLHPPNANKTKALFFSLLFLFLFFYQNKNITNILNTKYS